MASFENHPLAPYPGKKKSSFFRSGKGEGEVFVGVFFKYITMSKTKKKDKMKTKAKRYDKSLLVEPSSECKEFIVALIGRFYECESTMFDMWKKASTNSKWT